MFALAAEDMLADLCGQRLLCQPFERIERAQRAVSFFDAASLRTLFFRYQRGVVSHC